jgi:hypothetical protein
MEFRLVLFSSKRMTQAKGNCCSSSSHKESLKISLDLENQLKFEVIKNYGYLKFVSTSCKA